MLTTYLKTPSTLVRYHSSPPAPSRWVRRLAGGTEVA